MIIGIHALGVTGDCTPLCTLISIQGVPEPARGLSPGWFVHSWMVTDAQTIDTGL